MTREEKLQKAHQMFDNRNLLTELKWQREYFKRGYVSNQEELFNLWIFDKCIKALEKEPKRGHWFVDERPESDREIICSNCEQPIFKYHKIDFDYRPKFCPNCGADMREVQE